MFNKETLLNLGEYSSKSTPIAPPIYQSSSFVGGGEYSYTRLSNPTRRALEQAVANLEGGKYGFAFCSGLSALSAVLMLLKAGDKIILADDLYGGTYRLVTKLFSSFGIGYKFCDTSNKKELKRVIKSGVNMVIVESPTNPMMKISPLEYIASLCKECGAIFVVDNTFLTPIFQNPLGLGADIVVHSATKFLSGHHDTMAGVAVTNNKPIADRLSLISSTLGNALSPFDSWLVLRGLRTLDLRMKKHQQNALAIAEFLKNSPLVERVYYPGLKESKGYRLSKKQASGFGGVVSFYVTSEKIAKRLIKGGEIIKFAESLGGYKSLITYPITQTHASIPKETRERMGINSRLLRLSVGLENSADIINDLKIMLIDK